jgi:Zn-dependent alcohol dehydrogenase
MRGAIFHGPREPLTVEVVEVDRLLEDEVLVRVVASGVCHSDSGHWLLSHSGQSTTRVSTDANDGSFNRANSVVETCAA